MSRKTIFTVLMTPYLLMGYAIIAATATIMAAVVVTIRRDCPWFLH
ncbi:MAG: hypothetical protein M0R41_15945 [Methylobacter tundripaludum]|uniref:Uncharacterized protein n=1 Tax=Methylobacter tundripaludum TaxID=173365 RepID=A0A2S6H273_9GAMM|nr:hypothetical protein [Methylobacter tundripaludum]MCK9637764.1 hypothetical protein [Methylobacter tundripaludum]PPK71585.1 hypothetical protein B0F88_107109 [Methylobacter tundripaludum]